MKKVWDGVRSIINISKKSKKTLNCLKINNEVVTDNLRMTSSFNKFFSSIATKIESRIVKTDLSHHSYLKNPANISFFLTPTDPGEVKSIIQSLSNNRAT